MKYTTLGKTDISVSRICVGCMSYGKPSEDFHLWTLGEDDTREMVRHALDLGVNFFDTANCYSHGTSEEFLGSAIKRLGVKREDVVLASKVYFNDGHLSRKAIMREIDGTLQRLQTDHLDLYQIHRYDYQTPIEETMEALHSLVKVGKVRAIGASAMYGYQFHNMQIAAERNGWTLFSTLQNHYNLMYREDERELIPLADHTKENDLQIIERVAELADRLGVTMSEVALAWQFKRGVAAPIVGATNKKHFDDAVHSVDLMLSDEDASFLEAPYRAHEVVGAVNANVTL